MMKAHGIAPNAASTRAASSARPFKREPKETTAPSKKRKTDDFANDNDAAEDDQEQFDNVKSEAGNGMEELRVKEEPRRMTMTGDQSVMQLLPQLNVSGGQGYGEAGSMYDHSVGSYIPADHANVYGLGEQPQDHHGYFSFANYEQPHAADAAGMTNQSMVGQSMLAQSMIRQSDKHEPILIGD
jgi:hypothetical protein